MTILQQILAQKAKEVAALPANFPPRIAPLVPFYPTQKQTLAIIAEIKRASPSKGVINEAVDPVKQAKLYEQAGAMAISVLTDELYFKGSMADMAAVKAAVAVSVLNKDFIISTKQIDHAYAYGADMILLIVAALTDDALQKLYQYARTLQLDVLVETHNAEEFARASALGARIIGINHRNLHDFTMDLTISASLLTDFNKCGRLIIAESGIGNRTDAERLASAGVDGLLVGETLMRSTDPATCIQQLQVPRYAY